jgi:GDPmannose 4,6-dehydratase
MAARKIALITGVTGQDGAYLARFLLDKGYVVHGLRRYEASDDTARLKSVMDHRHFHLHYGDMTDGGGLFALVNLVKPDEIYNLAGLSQVHVSFTVPEYTADADALGTLRLLEAVRTLGLVSKTRIYQASTSEMYGNAPAPQNEDTPFAPRSPYGTAKLFAYWTMRNYRDAYGMHASNGILFNHESPLRGEEFVTRKITRAVAAIAAGRTEKLMLGNLDARRDWGHAADYVEGMWLMLQQDAPGDFVLATGEAHSVRAFTEAAFMHAGMTIEWRGRGPQECGFEKGTGRMLVQVAPELFRPAEVHALLGDAAKARRMLGWAPRIGFEELVREMMAYDLQQAGVIPPQEAHFAIAAE